MLMDHMTLADRFKDYASPRAKIIRAVELWSEDFFASVTKDKLKIK